MTKIERGIPAPLNILLGTAAIVLGLYQFLLLPLWVLPLDVRWAWTLLPLALLNNPYWSLIHEAIHDLFHPRRKVNMIFGRVLAILFGSPFRILRTSHLLHHQLNRTPIEGTEFYERGKRPLAAAIYGYYFQILGGLYLVEALSPVLFFLSQRKIRQFHDRWLKPGSVSAILMQNWTRNEAIREIRVDGVFILVWVGLAFFLYGALWPLLLAVFAARGFLISFLDNVYHYGTPVGDIFYARNLWLPRIPAGVLLNFNYHGIHHENPAMSWIQLATAFRNRQLAYQGNYFVAAVNQLTGPVALQDLPPMRPAGES